MNQNCRNAPRAALWMGLGIALAVAAPAFAAGIHEAAQRGDMAAVRALVDKDPALADARDGYQRTPLLIAAYNGRTEIVAYLLEKGAPVETRNRYSNTPLMLASMQGHEAVVETLLKAGAALEARGDNGATALMHAAGNNRPRVVRLLLDHHADPNAVADQGVRTLNYALQPSQIEPARLLLAAGAQVNYTTSDGFTPLAGAAMTGNRELLPLLLERGASADQATSDGGTLLTLALRNGHPDVAGPLLPKIKRLDAFDKEYGRTALHWAAIGGYTEVARRLQAAGASPALKDKSGRTAADYRARYTGGEVPADQNIFYLGHSGWAVKTARRLLVFDYAPQRAPADRPSLRNGAITPADLKGRDVYVFASHGHSDHFDPAILQWNARYIFGFDPAGVPKTNVTVVPPNQQQTVGDVTVHTLRSIDDGVAFLVTVDGLTIFHAGDHANLNAGTRQVYEREIDSLARQAQGVDIAFLPVTGCSSTWRRESVIDGFLYAIQAFKPKMVFPMHGGNREEDYLVFAQAAKDRGLSTPVLTAENPGDAFRFR
jgi:ankyrin repeat protein/L-ascorbate metabolism protein UlaG (beta-lactamase superfamily)